MLHNHTSINKSGIFNSGHIGDICDVIAIAVGVTAGDRLTAAGDGKPTNTQNSWELPSCFGGSYKATLMVKRIVGLHYPLLQVLIKKVLNNAAQIVVMFCNCWVHNG